MWLIAILILIAALLLIAEVALIPGLSVAGVGAFLAAVAAVWMAFAQYGTWGGLIVLGIVAVVCVAAVILALRSGTWERFSLKNSVDGVSQQSPEQQNVAVGDRGMALSRLAPMGKVIIGEQTFEAKSIDAYIDQNSEVEVTGFDNFNIIVRKV